MASCAASWFDAPAINATIVNVKVAHRDSSPMEVVVQGLWSRYYVYSWGEAMLKTHSALNDIIDEHERKRKEKVRTLDSY